MDAITIKMDAQYKKLQAHAKQPTPDLDDDDIPMSREEETKFMQTFLVLAEPLCFKEKGVYGVVKDVLIPWYNAYRFLVQNANRLATFDPLNPDTLLNSANVLDHVDVIDEILEEDLDALLDEGSKILHSDRKELHLKRRNLF
ncbi:hypothetical protein Tco_0286214 [Tanacetum coccineum]